MEQKRNECEVVENSQEVIVTDAKASNGSKGEASVTESAPLPAASGEASGATQGGHPQPQRRARKSKTEIKAWMDKQKQQCQVVESTQQLVATDAKSSCISVESSPAAESSP